MLVNPKELETSLSELDDGIKNVIDTKEELVKNGLKQLDDILVRRRAEYLKLFSQMTLFETNYEERLVRFQQDVKHNELLALMRKIENKWLFLRNHQNITEGFLFDIELKQNYITMIDSQLLDMDYFNDEFMKLKKLRVKTLDEIILLDSELSERIKLGRHEYKRLLRDKTYQKLLEEYYALTGKVFPEGAQLCSEIEDEQADEDILLEELEEYQYLEENDEDMDYDENIIDASIILNDVEGENDQILNHDYQESFLFLDDDFEDMALEKQYELEEQYALEGKEYILSSELTPLQQEIENLKKQRLINLVKECRDWCISDYASIDVKNNSYFYIRQVNEAYSQFDLDKIIKILMQIKGMNTYTFSDAYQADGYHQETRVQDYILELRMLFRQLKLIEENPNYHLIQTPDKWESFFTENSAELVSRNQLALKEIDFYEAQISSKMSKIMA